MEEWTDMADSAGLTDRMDVKNVAQWINDEMRAGTRAYSRSASSYI